MYCRICLEETDSGINLFETTNSVEILQKISFCTEVSLCKSDILSNVLCQKCVFRIEESNILKKQCLLTEKLLKKLLEGGKIFDDFCQENLTLKQLKILKEVSILDTINGEDESHEVKIKIEGETKVKTELEFEHDNNDCGNEYVDDRPIQNIENNLHIKNNDLQDDQKCIKKSIKHVYAAGVNKKKVRSYKKRKTDETSRVKAIKINEDHKTDSNVVQCYVCDECGHMSASKSAMSRHINDHQRAKYKCPACDLSFPSQKALDSHIKGTHGKIKAFPCDICGKKYVSLRKLNKHRVNIHRDYRKQKYLKRRLEKGFSVRCGRCDVKFDSKLQYQRHYQAVHKGGKKTHVCDICGQEIAVARCQEHRLRHFPPAHPCGDCAKKFYTETELRAHRQIVHLGISKHACEECGRLETSPGALERHRLSRHSGTRDFDCALCRKAFATRVSYRRHIVRHYDTRRTFTCNKCGVQKKIRSRLDKHMLKAHALNTKGEKSCKHITATGTSLSAAEKEEISELVQKKYRQVQELKKTDTKFDPETKVS